MSLNQTPITQELAAYISAMTPPEPEAIRRVREETANHPKANYQISPEQGRLLNLLVRATGAKHALEVGVFMGYSSLWIASALPDDGRLIACDLSAEYTARARQAWRDAGLESKIDLRLAPALDTLDALLAEGHAGTFDFAFIDADKENYINYYERALKLMRSGGLIAADNVLYYGRVAAPAGHDPDVEPLRAFNAHLRDDPRIQVSVVPIGDGITLACKL